MDELNWQRLRPVLDDADVVVFVRDCEGRYLYVNHAFEQLVGRSAAEVLGRSIEEVLPAETAAAVRASDRQAIEERRGVVFEARGRFGSGLRSFANFKFPLLDGDGRSRAVLGFGTDTTERRRRDEALEAASLAVSSAQGDRVFQELTRYLATILNVDLALVGRITDKRPPTVRTLGIYGTQGYKDNVEYPLDVTPCREVVSGGFSVVARDVAQRYPADKYLPSGAVGYAGYPLKDAAGKTIGVVAVVSRQPIVDEKLAESVLKIFALRAAAELERNSAVEALGASEEQYRAIFNASADSLVLRDAEFRVVDVNPAYEAMSGRQRDEALGRSDLTMSPPELTEHVKRLHARALAGERVVFEALARRKDGSRFNIETRGVPILHKGQPHVLYIGRDITARKTEEELLRASEEQYRAIFDASDDALVLWNSELERVDVNAAYERIYGYARDEVLGGHYERKVPPEYAERRRALVKRTLAGERCRVELETLHQDGRRIHVEVRTIPIRHRGKPHVLAISRDVTERKAAEAERAQLEAQLRQAQKMEAIGQLTGGIAHDFNNILQSILGNLTLAGERTEALEDPKLARALERARISAQRARELIHQMLTFSRGRRGEPRLLSLPELVGEAAKLLRPTLPSTIGLGAELGAQVPAIKADPVQLEQVLLNLCINARDAMGGTGSITLEVREASYAGAVCTACRQKFSGGFVELSVRDSGPGIAQDVLDRMFEPFFSTKEVGMGSGMGLSMVHGIVHEHGGHILVDTAPGLGARFRVALPAVRGSQVEAAPRAGPQRQERRLTGSVLVVDDEELVLELVGDLLSDWGLEVTLKSSAEEARQAFAAEPQRFDVVLTDHTMPRVTGLELARDIQAIRAGTPVVLYTGYGDDIPGRELAAANVLTLARKPVEPAELFNLLKTSLKQSHNTVK
jgi:PAS domain S-box-containing protein